LDNWPFDLKNYSFLPRHALHHSCLKDQSYVRSMVGQPATKSSHGHAEKSLTIDFSALEPVPKYCLPRRT
jgi:hypothetical protein